jgi:hypothetical protein
MNTKIFHVSIPFEQPNTGDYDYGTALVGALNESGQRAEYVNGTNAGYALGSKEAIGTVSHAVELVNSNRGDAGKFQDAYKKLREDSGRKEAIQKIEKHILDTAKKENVTPILNLQLRAPETGFAFMPEDLQQFKAKGIKVNVTCHEYKLNNTRRHLQSVLHEYFNAADTVTFFNPKDENNACKHANQTAFEDTVKFPVEGAEKKLFSLPSYPLSSKTLLTRVPPTVKYERPEIAAFEKRPPNLIAFGLIRENKGFEEAIDIAKNINKKIWTADKKPRMIIAGAPGSSKLLAKIICAKYTPEALKKIISENINQVLKDDIDKIATDCKNLAQKAGEIDELCQKEEFKQLVVTRVTEIVKCVVEHSKMQIILKNIAKNIQEQQGKKVTTETVKTAISDKAIESIIKAPPKVESDKSLSDHARGIVNEYTDLSSNKAFQKAIEEKVTTTLTTNQDKTIEKILEKSSDINGFVVTLLNRTSPEDLKEEHPIDLHLNVEPDKMLDLFKNAKYAVKIDNKGWANNASGHINALANGCIVYTGWGMDTPDEVLPKREKENKEIKEGKYYGAVVLPKGKYGLRSEQHLTTVDENRGEKQSHYGSSSLQTKDPLTADKVLNDIQNRENDLAINRETFEKSTKLFDEQFSPKIIAKTLVNNLEHLTQEPPQHMQKEAKLLHESQGKVLKESGLKVINVDLTNSMSPKNIKKLKEIAEAYGLNDIPKVQKKVEVNKIRAKGFGNKQVNSNHVPLLNKDKNPSLPSH